MQTLMKTIRISDIKAKVKAQISFLQAKYASLPDGQKPIVSLAAVLIGILLLLFLVKACIAIVSSKNNWVPTPLVIRQDHQLFIPQGSALRKQLQFKTVNVSDSPYIVAFPGTVEAEPKRVVNILPPLTGRLIALKVKWGENVKQGQILAVIRSPGLAQAYSDHDKALSVLKYANEALKRARSVNRAGANAIKDIEQALSSYQQAVSEVQRTEAVLKTLGKNSFSELNVTAPIAGQITAINYGLGSFINDPTASLFTIYNLKSVWVTANIPENFIGLVRKDLPADVVLPAYPTERLHGKVGFVNAYFEPDTRRNKTRIYFENPNDKLQPNMYATVSIALPQPDRIIVPISAVLMNSDTTSVFVEVKPWTIVRRDVELGPEDGEQVRVLSGLNAGDRVVTSGGVLLND